MKSQSTSHALSVSLVLAALAAGCEDEVVGPPDAGTTTTAVPTATGDAGPAPSASAKAVGAALSPCLFFPEMKVPEDNPLNEAKIELGKMLFFDKRLGKDGQFSCESCHFVDKGWADALPVSKKADGTMNARHTPSIFNVGYNEAWYWDGRAPTLEAQVLAAWKGQMGGDPEKVPGELATIDEYKKRFKAAFDKDEITGDDVVKALSAYVRTVRSCNAAYDKWEKDKKSGAMSESAVRGFEVFRNKAGCALCHAPPLFTDLGFHNVGVGYDKPNPDPGRGKVTEKEEDKGKFKTPSLRGVTLHPPYFHDGSAKTIEEAVDYMLGGGHANPNLDKQLKKVVLSGEERADLIEFLKALEGEKQVFEPPKLP